MPSPATKSDIDYCDVLAGSHTVTINDTQANEKGLSYLKETRTSYPNLEPASLQQSCCCARLLALRLVLMTFANGPKLLIP